MTHACISSMTLINRWSGKPWDRVQEQTLCDLFAEGCTPAAIACLMGRTLGSVNGRIWKLGLTRRRKPPATQRKPPDPASRFYNPADRRYGK